MQCDHELYNTARLTHSTRSACAAHIKGTPTMATAARIFKAEAFDGNGAGLQTSAPSQGELPPSLVIEGFYLDV